MRAIGSAADGNYQLSGNVDRQHRSQVRPKRLPSTQRSSVHYYQRPGDDLEYDPTRTDLSGYGLSLGMNKNGGGITRFWTGGWLQVTRSRDQRRRLHDERQQHGLVELVRAGLPGAEMVLPALAGQLQPVEQLPVGRHEHRHRRQHQHERHVQEHVVHVRRRSAASAAAICGACLRGGPYLREDANLNTWFGFSGDSRKSIVPGLSTWYNRRDGGRSYNYGLNPYFNIRVASRFSGR